MEANETNETTQAASDFDMLKNAIVMNYRRTFPDGTAPDAILALREMADAAERERDEARLGRMVRAMPVDSCLFQGHYGSWYHISNVVMPASVGAWTVACDAPSEALELAGITPQGTEEASTPSNT